FDVALLRLGIVPGVAHEHRDLAVAERVLRAEHDRDAEPAETIRGDQAHGERAAREQGLGQRVRREAEALRHLGDPLPGLGAQLALPVERFGGGANGHAGLGRHVTDGHPPHLRSSGVVGVRAALLTPRGTASSLRFRRNRENLFLGPGAAYVNSADQPPAVMSAADQIDLADREDRAGHAYHAVGARTEGSAAPESPPGSVTGPVAPTALASRTHQPL